MFEQEAVSATGKAALALFAASSIIFARRSRRDDAETLQRRASISLPAGVGGRIGSRGAAALAPAMSYLDAFLRCLVDPCDPAKNPKGHIALCMAENMLVTNHFAERLMQAGTVTSAFSDSIVYSYNGFLGLPRARDAVAYFIARRFLCPFEPSMAPEQALERINPQHVALGSGCASLLNYLCLALAEEGDAVLIPAPFYAAFESDIKTLAKCIAFPVQMADPLLGPSVNDLNAAAKKAKKQGLRARILLLTNPTNPLGVIYEADVIKRCVQWARHNRMHTIADEIYALSVHDKENHRFESVLRILDNKLDSDVHFLWALSKDFASSGFRVGVLYSQNLALLRTLANLNIFSGVSHPMQMIVAEILTDDEFVDDFLDKSRAELGRAKAICERKLNEMVIPYVPAEAGMFVYADFSSLLPSPTPEGEARFAHVVQECARVVMTPGQPMRDSKPGMFRICVSYNSLDVLEIAMERLSRLVAKIRKIGWDYLELSTIKIL